MTPRPEDPHIGLIVEGAGDKQGVPVLLRNYLQKRGDYRDILGKAIPCHGRGAATTQNGIEGFVSIAAARPGCVGVPVILDGEGDPVCELGPALQQRGQG